VKIDSDAMIYLDSNIIFSVHGRDANTLAAVSLLESASAPFLLSPLCEVEFANAIGLRLFRKEILPAQAQASIGKLEGHVRNGVYRLLPFPEGAFGRARALALSLTPAFGVRAADLLHVAAAIELGAETFYTFDRKQHAAARAAGLKVNPLA
jgi:predicted nucleic acid-binding protein